MSVKHKTKKYIEKTFTTEKLIPVTLTLVIVWLLSATSHIWEMLFNKAKVILLPFVLGFAFAYILRPIIKRFERYKIKRQFSVLIVIILVIGGVYLLFSSIMPSLYEDLTQIILSIGENISRLYESYVSKNMEPSPLIESIYKQISEYASNLFKYLANLPSVASSVIGNFIGVFTTILFSLMIGIYFVLYYEEFTGAVYKLANKIGPKVSSSIYVIDKSVGGYLKTMLVLILISTIEYSLLYWLIGNNYALVLGIITGISLVIPYVGPIVANTIGILTSLTLPIERIIILLVALVILSNIDGYVIQPLVYAKRDKVQPLWSIFSMFACSAIFGFIGLLLSMPIYFSIRAVYNLWQNNWKISDENEV